MFHLQSLSELKWDERWIGQAEFISGWSKDGSKVGAVAVTEDNVEISKGWNGFPRQVKETPDLIANREHKLKHTVHAEQNCIYNAGRIGVPLLGSTMYVFGLPTCFHCALGVIQAGITRVVCVWDPDTAKQVWKDEWEQSKDLMFSVGIDVYDVARPSNRQGVPATDIVGAPSALEPAAPSDPRGEVRSDPVVVHVPRWLGPYPP